jgi:hypothetical protein
MLNRVIYKAEINKSSFISNNFTIADLIYLVQGVKSPELVSTSGDGEKFFDADMKGDI